MRHRGITVSIKKHIPNFLTCCNLLCGCLGIFLAFHGDIFSAIVLIWAALIFDFLDGFVARLLKVSSPIGKELDSLADMVTFGVLPGFLLLAWMREMDLGPYLPFIAFLVPVFSALRLAKFNIDERQTSEFIGLPTPASTLFISSLYFLQDTPLDIFVYPYALPVVSVVMSLLLVAEIPMFSLKVSSMSWKGNELRIIFLLLSISLLAFFQLAALSPIILLYILLSIVFNRSKATQ